VEDINRKLYMEWLLGCQYLNLKKNSMITEDYVSFETANSGKTYLKHCRKEKKKMNRYDTGTI
jgi:hypothetical protein